MRPAALPLAPRGGQSASMAGGTCLVTGGATGQSLKRRTGEPGRMLESCDGAPLRGHGGVASVFFSSVFSLSS